MREFLTTFLLGELVVTLLLVNVALTLWIHRWGPVLGIKARITNFKIERDPSE